MTDNKNNDESDENNVARDEPKGESSDKSGEKKKTSPLSRPLVRISLIVIVLAVLIGGGLYLWHYWTVGRFIQSTNDAYMRSDQSPIAPKVQGYVKEVLVADNQVVDVGKPLVKIDDSDYKVAVDQARAGVAASKADLARAHAEAKRQVVAIGQAEAQLSSAKSQAAFAQQQVERYKPLAKTGAATDEQMAQLVSQRDQANAQVDIAEASLASAKEAVNTAQAAIAQAEASRQQSDAQLAKAELDLSNTVIVAPIAGTVGDKTVTIGQYTQPGQRMLTLVPVNSLYLEANFKETQIELMRAGQPATIKVDAISSEELHGVVESFSPGTGAQFSLLPPENATGNFTKIVQRIPVRIRVDAGPEARKILLPGLSVTVEVDTIAAKQEEERLKREGEQAENQK